MTYREYLDEIRTRVAEILDNQALSQVAAEVFQDVVTQITASVSEEVATTAIEGLLADREFIERLQSAGYEQIPINEGAQGIDRLARSLALTDLRNESTPPRDPATIEPVFTVAPEETLDSMAGRTVFVRETMEIYRIAEDREDPELAEYTTYDAQGHETEITSGVPSLTNLTEEFGGSEIYDLGDYDAPISEIMPGLLLGFRQESEDARLIERGFEVISPDEASSRYNLTQANPAYATYVRTRDALDQDNATRSVVDLVSFNSQLRGYAASTYDAVQNTSLASSADEIMSEGASAIQALTSLERQIDYPASPNSPDSPEPPVQEVRLSYSRDNEFTYRFEVGGVVRYANTLSEIFDTLQEESGQDEEMLSVLDEWMEQEGSEGVLLARERVLDAGGTGTTLAHEDAQILHLMESSEGGYDFYQYRIIGNRQLEWVESGVYTDPTSIAEMLPELGLEDAVISPISLIPFEGNTDDLEDMAQEVAKALENEGFVWRGAGIYTRAEAASLDEREQQLQELGFTLVAREVLHDGYGILDIAAPAWIRERNGWLDVIGNPVEGPQDAWIAGRYNSEQGFEHLRDASGDTALAAYNALAEELSTSLNPTEHMDWSPDPAQEREIGELDDPQEFESDPTGVLPKVEVQIVEPPAIVRALEDMQAGELIYLEEDHVLVRKLEEALPAPPEISRIEGEPVSSYAHEYADIEPNELARMVREMRSEQSRSGEEIHHLARFEDVAEKLYFEPLFTFNAVVTSPEARFYKDFTGIEQFLIDHPAPTQEPVESEALVALTELRSFNGFEQTALSEAGAIWEKNLGSGYTAVLSVATDSSAPHKDEIRLRVFDGQESLLGEPRFTGFMLTDAPEEVRLFPVEAFNIAQKWAEALPDILNTGYHIDRVELEFAETRPQMYPRIAPHTQLDSLEAAEQLLLGRDRILQDARAALTPEDKQLKTDAYYDAMGYDKHWIDVDFSYLNQKKEIEQSKIHLRFDVGDGPEVMDVVNLAKGRIEEHLNVVGYKPLLSELNDLAKGEINFYSLGLTPKALAIAKELLEDKAYFNPKTGEMVWFDRDWDTSRGRHNHDINEPTLGSNMMPLDRLRAGEDFDDLFVIDNDDDVSLKEKVTEIAEHPSEWMDVDDYKKAHQAEHAEKRELEAQLKSTVEGMYQRLDEKVESWRSDMSLPDLPRETESTIDSARVSDNIDRTLSQLGSGSFEVTRMSGRPYTQVESSLLGIKVGNYSSAFGEKPPANAIEVEISPTSTFNGESQSSSPTRFVLDADSGEFVTGTRPKETGVYKIQDEEQLSVECPGAREAALAIWSEINSPKVSLESNVRDVDRLTNSEFSCELMRRVMDQAEAGTLDLGEAPSIPAFMKTLTSGTLADINEFTSVEGLLSQVGATLVDKESAESWTERFKESPAQKNSSVEQLFTDRDLSPVLDSPEIGDED